MSPTSAGASRGARHFVLAALCALLLLLGVVPAPAGSAAVPADPVPVADRDSTVDLTLTSVAPSVLRPGSPINVVGQVTNNGSETLETPVVRVALSSSSLATRTRVAEWLDGNRTLSTTQVATVTLDEPLAAGRSRQFNVTVAPDDLPDVSSQVTSIPLRFTVTDGSSTARGATRAEERTALPYAAADAQFTNPLEIGWVVPLTLPADPALFSSSGEDRLAAWRRAIGPGSAIDERVSALRGLPVTWLVDPTILEPPIDPDPQLPPAGAAEEGSPDSTPSTPPPSTPTPTPTPSSPTTPAPSTDPSGEPTETGTGTQPGATGPTTTGPAGTDQPTDGASVTGAAPTPSPTPSTTAPAPSPTTTTPEPPTDTSSVDGLVSSLRSRLVARPSQQPVWLLPYGDPDTVALQRAGGSAALEQLLGRAPSTATDSMSDVSVSWPAADLRRREATAISSAWRSSRDTPPVTLLSTRQLQGTQRPETSTVARELSDGTPVLAYDESLSAATASSGDAGTRTRRFLADSLGSYLEAPSRDRSALVLAPRADQASGSELASLITATTDAPWLRSVGADALRTAEGDRPRAQIDNSPAAPPSPQAPSPISGETLQVTEGDRRTLDAVGTVLVDSDDVITGWSAAFDELASARWRGQRGPHSTTAQGLHEAIEQVPRQVAVRPSSVNFFTDAGQVGVLVVNDLNRPVRDVRLLLNPRRYVVAVEEQPEPLSLGAQSRLTVRVPFRAVAAGRVRIDAVLTTPAGTPLGAPADAPSQLEFNVRPTGTWLYWVMGAVAGPILVVGLYRSLRRGPRPHNELDAPVDAGASSESDDD